MTWMMGQSQKYQKDKYFPKTGIKEAVFSRGMPINIIKYSKEHYLRTIGNDISKMTNDPKIKCQKTNCHETD